MSNLQNPIRVYDTALNLVSELDNYQSAYFTRSWYGVGDFSIQTNINMPHAEDLQKGYFVMFGKDTYRLGIITSIDKKVDQDGKGSETVTASGFEVPFIYSWRIVLPQTSSAVYTLTNSAETVMKTLVKDQSGSTADADRRFALQTIATDSDRGDTYVLNVRYNSTVADELQKISQATNVGYFCYLDEANKKFIFDIGLGVDRTSGQSTNARAIFSKDFDTLKSASFVTSDNQYRNYAYVAGQGVGTARTVREIYNTTTEPTDMSRKEIFIDARDLSTTGDLDARADQKLGEYAIQLTVDGAPLNKSTLVYRTDYDLGDIVTISALDTSYDARITEVKETWSPLAYDIDLTFDKEPASLPTQVNRAVESVRANLSQTEGYIIESGSNANGSYRKFSDGTMDQWGSIPAGTTSSGGPWPTQFYYYLANANFPVSFINTTYIITAVPGTGSFPIAGYVGYAGRYVSNFSIYIYNTVNESVTGYGYWHAIGRWRA